MHYSLISSALAVGAILAPSAVQATATISVTGPQSCTSTGSQCVMKQDYGDTDRIDVSYEWIKTDGTVLGLAHNSIGNYGDLGQVIAAGYQRDGTLGRVTLRARAGYELSLLDFDFAGYINFAPALGLTVLDLAGNQLIGGTFSTGTVSTHGSLAVNSAFLEGVVIRWGPDAALAGIDNIRYEARAVVSAVPEPETWAMMILGFAAIGISTRLARRKEMASLAAA